MHVPCNSTEVSKKLDIPLARANHYEQLSIHLFRYFSGHVHVHTSVVCFVCFSYKKKEEWLFYTYYLNFFHLTIYCGFIFIVILNYNYTYIILMHSISLMATKEFIQIILKYIQLISKFRFLLLQIIL